MTAAYIHKNVKNCHKSRNQSFLHEHLGHDQIHKETKIQQVTHLLKLIDYLTKRNTSNYNIDKWDPKYLARTYLYQMIKI